MSYDPNPKFVEVSVKNKPGGHGSGGLEASVSPATLTFTNTYTPPPSVNAKIKINKEFNGRIPTGDDEFKFQLFKGTKSGNKITYSNQYSDEITIKGDNLTGSFQLNNLEAGTYYYKVVEVKGSIPNVSYDPNPRYVEISVSKGSGQCGGCGELKATVTPDTITFTNTYTPDPAKATIKVQKVLNGREWKDGDAFVFKLSGKIDNELVIDEATVLDRNPVSFKELTFTKAGEYKFFVSEVEGSIPGINYDKSVKEVKVSVTFDNATGKFSTVVSEVGSGGGLTASNLLTFTNTYKPDPVKATIKVQKVLNGRDWKQGDKFTFKLSGRIGKNWVTREISVTDGVAKSFGELTFTKPGEYEFSIREVSGSIPGVHYDRSVKKAKVNVTKDNVTGELKAVVSGGGTAGGNVAILSDLFVFTNNYKAKSTKATIIGTKSLNGRALKKGEFTFKLYRANADGQIEGNAIASTRNEANGIWKFALNYNQGQAGTYYYVVKEVNDGRDYIGYATNEILYKVVVYDNLIGSMKARVFCLSDENFFENTYSAIGSWTPEVTKELTGRALKYQEFTFVLKDSEGVVLQTVQNEEDGSIPFGPINFNETQLGVHAYTISELIPDEADKETGMTYDGKVITFTVTVFDPWGKGKLKVKVGEVEDTVFLNEYEASGSLELEATKELIGRELKEGEFKFLLKDINEDVVGEATNAQDGTIVFDSIPYTEEDIGKTFTYTIEEVAGTETGMDYATNVVTVTVEVSDAGEGDLDLDVIYEDEAVFTNTYKASGSYSLSVKKEMVGRALVEGEFDFELLDADDKQLLTAKNQANGQVVFGLLSFDQDDIGKTYSYKVREIAGQKTDIIYDDTEYSFTLKIEDKGNGVLDVIFESKAGELKFTNTQELVGGDEDTKEKVKGDEDKKTPVTGEKLSVYRYLGFVLLLLAASTVVLVRRNSKKEDAAE